MEISFQVWVERRKQNEVCVVCQVFRFKQAGWLGVTPFA